MASIDDGTISTREVRMVGEDVAEQIKALKKLGYGVKRIAREVGVGRNTVRGYLAGKVGQEQKRPAARALSEEQVGEARELYRTTGQGNAAVVRDLLRERGVEVPLRTLQRYVEPVRQERRAAEAATVRYETPPGQQVQVDFGQQRVMVGGQWVMVYLFVATLGYSRRIYVRAGLSQRQDEWKEGLEGALNHFGGRPEMVVVDNAKALVREHRGEVVRVHPAFEAYCKDRQLAVFVCRPYRARTKGKVESGVKYVKRNAVAGRSFESWEALRQHLEQWMERADQRVHGTTHQRPIDLFRQHEAAALRPLAEPGLAVASQRLRRKVANDCFVDVDRVRYSVPHRLARQTVEVSQSAEEEVVWHEQRAVARHRRSYRPYERVVEPEHFRGLLRAPASAEQSQAEQEAVPPAMFGRRLADYAAVVGGQP